MKLRLFLCICVCHVFWANLAAQSTIGKKLRVLPTCYNYFPTGEPCPDNEQVLAMAQQNLWIVFAESDGIQTYTNYTKGQPLKIINYMDAFFVINKKGNWLELAKWQLLDGLTWDQRSGALKKNLDYYGWVQEDAVLKWRHCLVDKDSRFTIKALTYDNAECMYHPENCGKKKSLKLFDDPGLTIPSKNGVNLFEFLYEFDRSKDGKSVLVGSTDELLVSEGSLAPRKILGWVPLTAIVEWKQRLVLEPNWDPEAVAERKSKNVKTIIFSDAESAQKFMNDPTLPESEYKDKIMWQDDPFDVKNPPEWYRLPILDPKINAQTLATQPLATGIRTPIVNKQGVVFNTDEQDHWRKEEGLQRENFRKVNVVFVIDGSKSMSTFQQSVYNAISSFIATIREQTSKTGDDATTAQANTYKIGAVIYRGAQDEKCNGEKLDVETKPLTADYDDLEVFVNGEIKKTGCGEREHTKQYFKGLYEAMRMFANCRKQSNLIVVIGSSGNEQGPEASRLKEVIQKEMIDYQVGMLAFQVNSGYENYFTSFGDQSIDLIEGTSNGLRDSTGKSSVDKRYLNNNWINVPHLHKQVCPENSPVPGEFAFADASTPMNPDTLQNNIVGLINESVNGGEKTLNAIEAKIEGLGRDEPITQGVQLFLKDMGMDDKTIRKAAFENVQLYVKGYMVYKPTGFTYPLYKKCVFMQEQELVTLISTLSQIESPTWTQKELRQKMFEGFKGIVKDYFGPRESGRIIATKTGDEIMQLLIGIPMKDDIWSKFRLNQIMDKKIVPDDELTTLQNTLGDKLGQLKIYSDNDDHYFRSGDQKYIWVPEDYFP